MDCLQCKGPIEKNDESLLSNYLCHKCWEEMFEVRRELAKPLVAIMVLMSLSYSLSWSAFVNMPINEKYLLQNEMAQRLNMPNDIKSVLSSCVSDYAIHYPSEYKSAMVNVNKYLKNVSMPVAQKETKFIKVGDVYVSEAICKASPEQCVVAPVKNQTVVAIKPENKRTAAQCGAAREKDWQVYCWQNARIISCDAVAQTDKAMILDNLAEGYYSSQAICLRGE
jgi:hypothetical protein